MASKSFETVPPTVPSYEEAMNGQPQQLYPNIDPNPYYPQTTLPLADLQQLVDLVECRCIHVLVTYPPVQRIVLFCSAVCFCVGHALHSFTVRRCVVSRGSFAPIAVHQSNEFRFRFIIRIRRKSQL
ncbi:hypothetical protein HA402_000517 [Bradysia odoriphaga]|nr:hypothetical protein HA402_000517 [Bradysia odoriphaga]